MSSVKIVFSFISVDKNAAKRPVSEFLAENDYHFGYATYANGNIITELTDGQVEIANIVDPQYLEYFKWSTPFKYYEEDYYQGKVFLLLTTGEYISYIEAEPVQKGEVIYQDGSYVVLVYDSTKELMGYAESR
jgi:hypothetical protein